MGRRADLARRHGERRAARGCTRPSTSGGRHYVDGALKKTLHARVLLDEGVDLLLCLNPLVPFDASVAPRAPPAGEAPIPSSCAAACRWWRARACAR
jgi:hypothetical protein